MTIDFRAVEFIKQKIKEFNPKITVRRGSAVYDFLITTLGTIMQQYHFDLEDAFGDGDGIENYDAITEDRMDALVSNLIVSRVLGEYAVQQARVTVDTLGDYSFGEGELFAIDGEGNRFYNTDAISVSEETLSGQRDGVFYFFDASFTAEERGAGLGAIDTLEDTSDFQGFVSILGDETSLVDGIDRETNEELYARTKDSIAVRDLVTDKGIRSILNEQFPGVFVDIQPIGFGDEEMMRDIRFDFDGNKVNLHLGGYTDVHLKSNKLTEKTIDINSLALDTTREFNKDAFVEINGSTWVDIGFAPILAVNNIRSPAGTYYNLGEFDINPTTGKIRSTVGLNAYVIINYKYNPIIVDIKRIPDSGREDYTISDLVFIKVITIEELDVASGEPNGIFLERNGGFGQGPFGGGPFGIGHPGDWRLNVSYPHERYSMLEESFIEFEYAHIGKDVRITYFSVPEWANVHDFCRDTSERVTSADVLPRNFVPIFVDGEITVEVAASSADAPTEEEVIDSIDEFVEEFSSNDHLDLDLIIARLFDIGIARVDKTFEWVGEIHHVNGVVEFIRGDRRLEVPNPPLEKDTDMPISNRVTRFYPGEITVNYSVRSDL